MVPCGAGGCVCVRCLGWLHCQEGKAGKPSTGHQHTLQQEGLSAKLEKHLAEGILGFWR